MARTNTAAVLALLADNWDGLTDVQQFIDTASAVVDNVVPCAARRSISLSPTTQEIIERWLACHYYQVMDQAYASKTTAGASASFQGQTMNSIEGTKYGQSAINIDYSGCLAAISKRAFARGLWLGDPNKTPCQPCPQPITPPPTPGDNSGGDF